MINLNKIQLVIAWVIFVLISCLIIAPAIRKIRIYKYEATDGWHLVDVRSRYGEIQDEDGKAYKINSGKRYYYKGSYEKYDLNIGNNLYGRLIIIILLNGVLLIYTIGRKKQRIIQIDEKDLNTKDDEKL